MTIMHRLNPAFGVKGWCVCVYRTDQCVSSSSWARGRPGKLASGKINGPTAITVFLLDNIFPFFISNTKLYALGSQQANKTTICGGFMTFSAGRQEYLLLGTCVFN